MASALSSDGQQVTELRLTSEVTSASAVFGPVTSTMLTSGLTIESGDVKGVTAGDAGVCSRVCTSETTVGDAGRLRELAESLRG